MECEMDIDTFKDTAEKSLLESSGNTDKDETGLLTQKRPGDKDVAGPSLPKKPRESTDNNEAGPSTENEPSRNTDQNEDGHSIENKPCGITLQNVPKPFAIKKTSRGTGTSGGFSLLPQVVQIESLIKDRRRADNEARKAAGVPIKSGEFVDSPALAKKYFAFEWALSLVDPTIRTKEVIEMFVKKHVDNKTDSFYTSKLLSSMKNDPVPSSDEDSDDEEDETWKGLKEDVKIYVSMSEKEEVRKLYRAVSDNFGSIASKKFPILRKKMQQYYEEEKIERENALKNDAGSSILNKSNGNAEGNDAGEDNLVELCNKMKIPNSTKNLTTSITKNDKMQECYKEEWIDMDVAGPSTENKTNGSNNENKEDGLSMENLEIAREFISKCKKEKVIQLYRDMKIVSRAFADGGPIMSMVIEKMKEFEKEENDKRKVNSEI